MATWFYGGTRGMKNRTGDLTIGTATAGASVDVEVRVNSLDAQSKALTKKDLVQILKLVQDFVEQNGIPGNLGANLPPI